MRHRLRELWLGLVRARSWIRRCAGRTGRIIVCRLSSARPIRRLCDTQWLRDELPRRPDGNNRHQSRCRIQAKARSTEIPLPLERPCRQKKLPVESKTPLGCRSILLRHRCRNQSGLVGARANGHEWIVFGRICLAFSLVAGFHRRGRIGYLVSSRSCIGGRFPPVSFRSNCRMLLSRVCPFCNLYIARWESHLLRRTGAAATIMWWLLG